MVRDPDGLDPDAAGAAAAEDELAGLGFSPAQRAEWRERADQTEAAWEQVDVFEVWPENWDTLMLWLTCGCRYWRVAALGGCLGLDLVQFEAAARLRRLDLTPEQVEDLELMAAAALPILNRPETN